MCTKDNFFIQLSKQFFCMVTYRRLTQCCPFSSLMSVTVRPTRGKHAPGASSFLQRKLSQLSGQGVPSCPILHLQLIATVEIFCANKTRVLLWPILILQQGTYMQFHIWIRTLTECFQIKALSEQALRVWLGLIVCFWLCFTSIRVTWNTTKYMYNTVRCGTKPIRTHPYCFATKRMDPRN